MYKFLLIPFLFIFASCGNTPKVATEEELYPIHIPAGFPKLKTDSENPLTMSKVALGERLFFDPILSKDQTISCASCHLPDFAFSDTVQFSKGVNGKLSRRNSPSLINVAYHDLFMRDGGARTLEIQVLTPIQDSLEMNLNIDSAVIRLQNNVTYQKLFQKVFGSEPTLFGLTRALGAYQRTLISNPAKFDLYLAGEENLTLQELKGYELFSSKELKCIQCHSGFNFSNNQFRNNGLYPINEDVGRADVTLDSADIGKFKVPTLRNIALTKPYMHDGSLRTLEAVISHYKNGGAGNYYQDSLISGFDISEEETDALIAFLKTLTSK